MVDRSESIGGMKRGQLIAIQNRASYTDDRKGMADGYLKELTSFKINFKVKSYIVFDNNMELIKDVEHMFQNRFAMLTSIYKKSKQYQYGFNFHKYHKRGYGVGKRNMQNFFETFQRQHRNRNVVMNFTCLN